MEVFIESHRPGRRPSVCTRAAVEQVAAIAAQQSIAADGANEMMWTVVLPVPSIAAVLAHEAGGADRPHRRAASQQGARNRTGSVARRPAKMVPQASWRALR
jgi:hypothetical protein